MRVGWSPAGHPAIRVGFLGFHKYWNPTWNPITMSLAHRFALDVSDVRPDGHLDPVPDFLFTSVFERGGLVMQQRWCHSGAVGSDTEIPLYLDKRYGRCIKIHTSDECVKAPLGECDYAMTGEQGVEGDWHLRLPVYVGRLRFLLDLPCVRHGLLKRPNLSLSKHYTNDWNEIFASKTKFCNFVYTNPHAEERIEFCRLLSKYKQVDCGGPVLNNVGYLVRDKLAFLQEYKFTIAFENRSWAGYVTEKIVDPMIVRSVPIYWGSPTVCDDFNPRSLIVATGRNLADVVDEVVELDRDDAKYYEKMRAPWFHGDVPNRYCSVDYVADFMESIFKTR